MKIRHASFVQFSIQNAFLSVLMNNVGPDSIIEIQLFEKSLCLSEWKWRPEIPSCIYFPLLFFPECIRSYKINIMPSVEGWFISNGSVKAGNITKRINCPEIKPFVIIFDKQVNTFCGSGFKHKIFSEVFRL